MDGRKSIRVQRGEEDKCQFSYLDGVVVSVRSQKLCLCFTVDLLVMRPLG